MIKGFNHIALSTRDFEQSLAFYRDIIGMRVIFVGPFKGAVYDQITALQNAEGRMALLQIGTAQIELFAFSKPFPKKQDSARPVCDHGITHLCFEVDDIETEYQRLKKASVPFHCPPLDFGEHLKATYGRDPDGNVFELIEIKMQLEADY